MTKDQAARLVNQMLGSYPSLSLHDPKTYIANIVTLLCGYPLWAGQDAVGAVKKKTRFIPTESELYGELEDRFRSFRYAQEWERDAQRMIEQHALPPPPPTPKPTYEEMRAKYDGPNGEPWGIVNPDNSRRRPTRAQARASLIEKIGQEAFDAIPDTPKGGTVGAAAVKVAGEPAA